MSLSLLMVDTGQVRQICDKQIDFRMQIIQPFNAPICQNKTQAINFKIPISSKALTFEFNSHKIVLILFLLQNLL